MRCGESKWNGDRFESSGRREDETSSQQPARGRRYKTGGVGCPTYKSLVAQGFDGIEIRGAHGGEHATDQANQSQDNCGDEQYFRGHN